MEFPISYLVLEHISQGSCEKNCDRFHPESSNKIQRSVNQLVNPEKTQSIGFG